jgi:hypothetical protein
MARTFGTAGAYPQRSFGWHSAIDNRSDDFDKYAGNRNLG